MKKFLLATTLFLSLVTVTGCSSNSESSISQDSATTSSMEQTKGSFEKSASTEKKEAKQREAEETEADTTINQRDTESGLTGLCKDGTPASGNPSARGKANSCYGHGGWER